MNPGFSFRCLLLFACLFAYLFPAAAQTTNLSGIINNYYPVVGINVANASIQLSTTAGLQPGDKLLLIQMQGATIQSPNSSTFGTVSNLNGAGSYEIVSVCSITGNTLDLEYTLANTDYDASGKLQLVSIPTYVDATVTGTLTGQAWDGSSGGVLILEVEDSLRLNADIDMAGKGFRGGGYLNQVGNVCSGAFGLPVVNGNFFYGDPDFGGEKGEGIASYITGKEYGKGAQANGGGGANDHNAGGAGGGNRAAGGKGGDNDDQGLFTCKGFHPGLGGLAQTLTGRVIMGGGGGSGHGNNNTGSSGANGGGIIILTADKLKSNGFAIQSNGNDALNGNNDGAGGGGSGGTLQLNVNTFVGPAVLSATGGKGGGTNGFTGRCYGPGGGGAGGLIKTTATLPGSVITNLSGGNAGTILTGDANCIGSTSGAAAGSIGLVEIDVLPQSSVLSTTCVLPVILTDFSARPVNGYVLVEWRTEREDQLDYFQVERSLDARHFVSVRQTPGKGDLQTPAVYHWQDRQPHSGTVYYRLKQVDWDGSFVFSRTVVVHIEGASLGLTVYPNPLSGASDLILDFGATYQGPLVLNWFDLTGRQIRTFSTEAKAGLAQVPATALPETKGTFLLRITAGEEEFMRRIVLLP